LQWQSAENRPCNLCILDKQHIRIRKELNMIIQFVFCSLFFQTVFKCFSAFFHILSTLFQYAENMDKITLTLHRKENLIMKTAKKHLAWLTALLCIVSLSGCRADSAASPSLSKDSPTSSAPVPEPGQEAGISQARTDSVPSAVSVSLSKSDLDASWDDSASLIQLSQDSVSYDETDGLSLENNVLTIRRGGTYVLQGELSDGRIIVDLSDSTEKAHLVLNGVSVTSKTSSPLTILQADKTIITLADHTTNSLSDAHEYTDSNTGETGDAASFPSACLVSKDDLTINGNGTLAVNGNCSNGIHCKNDLRIVSGTINVQAENHGIRGNDSVLLHDGIVHVTCGGDGIKSSNDENEEKGFVLVEGGSTAICAGQDGIDAASSVTITDGILDITSGGGTENAPAHSESQFGGRGGGHGSHGNDYMPFNGNSPEMNFAPPEKDFHDRELKPEEFDPSGRKFPGEDFLPPDQHPENKEPVPENSTKTTSDVSMKGISADTSLFICGGTIQINSADDALHADNCVTVCGNPALTIASGDDGIHGDSQVTISDNAIISITESYEGIESAKIMVSGGKVNLRSTDDGFNASASGNDGSTEELEITGGYVYVNADGDGLDSNGDIKMTGGTVIICGPTNDGNGALDSGDNQNTIIVTGGTLIALGSTGMMEAPQANYIGSAALNASEGTMIVVTDSEGRVLGALKTPKAARGIVFSADGMPDGYRVYTGGTYNGTLNEDGWGTGGSYTEGSLITSGSGGIRSGNGFQRRGGGFGDFTNGNDRQNINQPNA